MSIALFALAAIMIVGGIVSVIQGFPFVRLESGLAMTIAGATTASAGAVVLGLAVVASRLRGLERTLAAGWASEAGIGDAALDGPGRADPRPGTGPVAAGTGLGSGLGAASAGAGREPAVVEAPPTPRDPQPSAVEPLLPNLLPAHETPELRAVPPPERVPATDFAPATEPPLFATRDRPADGPHGSGPEPEVPRAAPTFGEAPRLGEAPISAEAALFAETEAPALRPSLAEPAAPVELPGVEPESAPAVPEAEPVVVGTYASGGNTYVMYANGAIEAETPRGRFTFGSLDELKAFVEAGGETDTRGAA